MPQLQLPIFPEGMTLINANLGVMTQNGTVTYIYGSLPIFSHAVDDLKTFRMITSQLYVNGSVKQADICRAFGVSRISVKRSVKLYREKGPAGFFEPPRRRGPAVLTPEVLQNVQVIDSMGEYRQAPVNIGDGSVLNHNSQVGVDQGHPFRKNGQLKLRHGAVW